MRKLKLLFVLCTVAIAASASKTVYLVPGPWNADGARYALYMFNSDSDNAWVDFTDADGDGTFTAEFNDSYASMILCRMNGTEAENKWANKWGQTGNITAPVVDGLTFTITSNDSDNSTYTTSGDTYLYNVGANAYLQNGANWNTHAALKSSGAKLTIVANNGVYTIHNDGDRSGYFNSNGYVDSSTDNWTFEPISGANAFKLKSSANAYAYASSGMYNVDLGEDPGTNKAYWRLVTETKRNDVSNATNLAPVELTHKINNPRFDEDASGWEDAPSYGGNKPNHGDNTSTNDVANACAEHYNKTYDTYQTLTGLANGTYAVSVQGFYREGGYAAAAPKHVAGTESLNAIFYANDVEQPLMSIFEEAGKASGGGTKTADGINGAFPNDMSAASYFFSANLYWNTVYVTVTDGSLKIGVKKSTAVSDDWTIFDNFRIQYFGNCSIAEAQNGALIVAYNEALANAQSIAALAMNADVKAALNGVINSNNSLDTSTATAAQLTAATNALNDAVATAQPSVDIYATIRSLLNGMNTQDATFDVETKYNAGTYATVSEVYSDYYAYEINKLGTAANTDFTNAIVNPSFEYGNTLGWTYEPSNDHGAKTYNMSNKDGNYIFNIWSAGHPITQTIEGLPNGLYELKAVVANSSDGDPAKVYLLANDIHEGITCDTNGDTGVEGSVKVAITDGKLTIGAVGSNNDTERSYIAEGLWWYKVDNFRLTYLGNVVSDEDAAALLATVPTGKMNNDVSDALDAAKTAFEASKTTDNYQALQTAIENANTSIAAYAAAKSAIDKANDIKDNNNVATAAAYTTFAEAIAAIETPYNNGTLLDADANTAGTTLGVVVSGWHANANGAAGKYMESAWDMPGNFQEYYINTWSVEGDNDGSGFSVPFVEYWTGDANSLGAKTMTATQEGLEPNGIYRVSMQLRVRQANSKTKVANSITLQVGDGTAVDVTTGSQVGTSQFYLDTFTAEGLADADGKLTIKLNVTDGCNISWLTFKNVKYEAVPYATDAEKDALAAAITAAEAKTLGFETDEYAPYNNVAAIEALATAKAIVPDATSGEVVVAATNALTGATWTANTEEVNAIYDGSFAANYSHDGNVKPTGWTGGTGHDNATDVRYMWNVSQDAGLAATTNSTALFTKYDAYYGKTVGYTMPLKANTEYQLTFKYGTWGTGTDQTKGDAYVQMEDANGNVITIEPSSLALTNEQWGANASTEKWYVFTGYFTTPNEGDYVLDLLKNTTSQQNQYVYGDIELKKAPDFTIAGSQSLFGTDWDVADANNNMTRNADGTYSKTYTDVALSANVEYKVVKNHAYANGSWPASNREIGIKMPGNYDVTINFNPATGEVSETMALYKEITDAKYATIYAPYDLNFDGTGVTAYVAELSGTTVEFNKVTSAPANTGLLLSADEGTYKLPMEVSSTDVSNNALLGVTENTEIAAGIYVLMNTNNKVGFYKTKNTFTVGAYTAYLPAIPGSTRDFIGFGNDETTGIEAISSKTMNGEVYNLQGQRVNKAQKGLYIVNGKKVVLK